MVTWNCVVAVHALSLWTPDAQSHLTTVNEVHSVGATQRATFQVGNDAKNDHMRENTSRSGTVTCISFRQFRVARRATPKLPVFNYAMSTPREPLAQIYPNRARGSELSPYTRAFICGWLLLVVPDLRLAKSSHCLHQQSNTPSITILNEMMVNHCSEVADYLN
jgi:hypothetical protein